MQKNIEIEQHLLFFIDFIRVPKCRVRPIGLVLEGLNQLQKIQMKMKTSRKIQTKLRNKTTAVFQQDGAPPHWSLATRALLNTTFPGRWIGRAGATDQNMLDWPPRSPDITPLDFFLWGYVKNDVYASFS